jgi:tRNA 2-thiouridine synthesizing protein E
LSHYTADPRSAENSNGNIEDRLRELSGQRWNRGKSLVLAESEGIPLTDEHWAVIVFMRRHYLEHGLSINARTASEVLGRHFSAQGGSKYLHRLFGDGPVTQASRLANLPTPASAMDPSFGSSY